MADGTVQPLNALIFSCQQVHIEMHHMGLLRVYADCRLCLALHTLATAGREITQTQQQGEVYGCRE